MMESRRMPRPTPPSTEVPWPSGPRCAITSHIRSSTSSRSATSPAARSRSTKPPIPHMPAIAPLRRPAAPIFSSQQRADEGRHLAQVAAPPGGAEVLAPLLEEAEEEAEAGLAGEGVVAAAVPPLPPQRTIEPAERVGRGLPVERTRH